MCGIWTYISNDDIMKDYYDYFMKIKHRGPDASIYTKINNVSIGFHRLSILETSFNANQPYMIDNNILICNGEIYNYKYLINKYNLDIKNDADCLTILYLYKNLSIDDFIHVLKYEIKAEFSFIIFEFDNNKLSKIIASRDHIGVRPLYYGSDLNNNLIFSSELKGIPLDYNGNIKEFECGHLYINDFINNDIKLIDYRYIYNTSQLSNLNPNFYFKNIRKTLTKAIERRLLSDSNIEIGFLLSGGLDSSLICSIASRILKKKIKTFSIGFKDSTDLIYAKNVANFINSDHTEIIIKEEDALNCINDVIYTTCTYDITTIRASTPQYLICKYIKENTNIKVIIGGDGSDEVLGGYIFNHKAPNENDFDKGCKDFVENIHLFDGRRLDRCTGFFGLEARLPYLDLDFIKSIWEIPASLRMPSKFNIEKYLLRKAFEGYLPIKCLYRKKEAFSDGISSKDKSWYITIQDNIDKNIMRNDCPTLESSYYKSKFIEYFNENRCNILNNYWQPLFINNNKFIDPSARELKDIY